MSQAHFPEHLLLVIDPTCSLIGQLAFTIPAIGVMWVDFVVGSRSSSS